MWEVDQHSVLILVTKPAIMVTFSILFIYPFRDFQVSALHIFSYTIVATSFLSLLNLMTHTHTHTHTALGCDAETTEFFFWNFTLAGTTQTLQCPTTTTMISRTCSSSGVWESVDTSLCTSFTSINTVSFMHESGSKPWSLQIVIFNSVRLYLSANYRAFEQFMTSSCVHNK